MPTVEIGSKVAVTGASGFIGSHIVHRLLEGGYVVHAVVRDKDNELKTEHLRKMATDLGKQDALHFFSGDLLVPGDYDEAFDGVDAVIHSAAVVEIQQVKDPQKQIVDPSVEGTKNVIGSIDKTTTVQRVVHTSSVAAVHDPVNQPDGFEFNETHYNTYSTLQKDPYGFAKTTTEKLITSHTPQGGNNYDVVAINPVVVLGPCFTKAHTKSSAVLLREVIYGNAMLEYQATYVDVRDVAEAHVKALSVAEAAGDRFIVANDLAPFPTTGLKDVAQPLFPEYILDDATSKYGGLKLWLGKMFGFVSEFEVAMIEKKIVYSNANMKKKLGLEPRDMDTTVRDTIQSMIDLGVKPRPRA